MCAEILIKWITAFSWKESYATLKHRWLNNRKFRKPSRKLAIVECYMVSLATQVCVGPNIPMNVFFPERLRIKGSVSHNAIALSEFDLEQIFLSINLLLKQKSLKNVQIPARTLAVRWCCPWFAGHQRSPWSPPPR